MPPDLLVCAPLRLEAWALSRHAGDHRVVRTGAGWARSARSAATLAAREFTALVVAGLAGGVDPRVRSGDVVVATEIRGPGSTVAVTGAAVLVEELRRGGLTVHAGPITTSRHLVHGAEREVLANTGALAVDMESAVVAPAAGARPVAAVRVVVDTADRPLLAPGTPVRALAGLARLRRLPEPLVRWAGTISSGSRPVAGGSHPRSSWEDS